MAQYYDVLSQGDKNTEQPFYNNVEDQTVQYVITPDKTQVQYPAPQIVVTSGEQLMVVDSQSQQIVIDPTTITYQTQQIPQQTQVQQLQVPQLQVQTQQYAVIQESSLNNGTQQIFFMDGNSSAERVIVEQAQSQQQPIVLNHQIGQTTIRAKPLGQIQQQIRAAIRQPMLQQTRPQARAPIRSPNPNQQTSRALTSNPLQIRPSLPHQASPQVRQPSPNPSQIRQPNPNQQMRSHNANQIKVPVSQPIRQPAVKSPGQQLFRPQNPTQLTMKQNQPMKQVGPGHAIRVPNQIVQQRMPSQPQRNPSASPRNPVLSPLQQKAVSQGIDLNDLDIKPSDEQEAVALPDGTIVTIAAYKKMLIDQKTKASPQKLGTTNATHNQISGIPGGAPTPTSTPTPKRRNPPNRTPRQPAKGGTRTTVRNRNVTQFASPTLAPTQPQQQANNDPSRYAMMSQHQPQSLLQQQQQQQQVTKLPQITQQQPALSQHQQQGQSQPPLLIQQQPQLQQQIRPSQANYVIQPPKMNQRPQQQRPLPAYIPSSQIQKIIESTPISEEFSDSIRMLVLLESGEQRLITFTLPKEACTIQEILEQVNVPFQNNTNIQVTEANSNGINYIVTVGNIPPLGYEEEESQMQEDPGPLLPPPTPPQLPLLSPPIPAPQLQASQLQPPQVPPPPPPPPALCLTEAPNLPNEEKLSPSPEPPKDQPKIVPGMLALCGACGYLSEDFAKCIRCLRKLPDSVKAIPATIRAANGQKRDLILAQQQAQQVTQQQQQQQQAIKANAIIGITPKPSTPPKKKKSKVVEQESVHVISSDEEEDETPSKVSVNLLQKLGASVTICPITKEPSPNDIQRLTASVKTKGAPVAEEQEANEVGTTVICRTVRIGSYRCIPSEKKVLVDSKQVVMKVPHPNNDKLIKTLKIDKSDIVKVLASFNPALPVFFYYLNPALAKTIREELDMTPDGDYYYDPLSMEEEAYRRITLLPDDICEDDRNIFQLIYGGPPSIMDELNVKEANDILIKTCPKELTKATLGIGTFTEIKQLLTYPPEGRGRISINTEDYVCLAQDQFLNDVIIDFYLKYLVESLPEDLKPKVHVFSTFFYKRLTTKPMKASRKSQPSELDPTLNPAQKRHARVKTWTKNVNLFEKDFIVVPINENAHWFLAIICFPGMDGPHTWDGKPYKLEVKSRPKKNKLATIGNVSVTPVKQEKIEKPIVCEDPELSDKDEAEGDDSEMESDGSEETPLSQDSVISNPPPSPPPPVLVPTVTSPPVSAPKSRKEPRPPIKQPCILIFDSLAGANRSRVVATLRDYLTCEHKVKLGKEKPYTKDIIKGANPKVPQQNNFTDCGLYVLQYVEQFFKDPIKDYNIPIKQIQNWFEEIVVTKKREDLANLIKSLMKEYGKDARMLPEIVFPTINGKLIEREFDDEEEMMEEDESSTTAATAGDESDAKDDSFMTVDSGKSELFSDMPSSADEINSEETSSPIKPSSESVTSDFVAQTVVNAKPDLREFPRQTSKDTLSILKAKRIIRHKNMEGPDIKKHKGDESQ